jgi:hypothetical protein
MNVKLVGAAQLNIIFLLINLVDKDRELVRLSRITWGQELLWRWH